MRTRLKKSYVCIVDLQVSTDDLKILSNTQHCLNGEYMSPATINILRSSSKAPEIFVQFRQNLDFSTTFMNFFNSSFIVGASPILADRWTLRRKEVWT
jgi:hypothetical protein